MILAIVDDLIFRGKVETTAARLGSTLTVAANADSALQPGKAWSRVLIDLNLASGDPLAIVRKLRQADPAVPVVGYCAHVQRELQAQAREAGCTTVLPRSEFVQQLPELLRG